MSPPVRMSTADVQLWRVQHRHRILSVRGARFRLRLPPQWGAQQGSPLRLRRFGWRRRRDARDVIGFELPGRLRWRVDVQAHLVMLQFIEWNYIGLTQRTRWNTHIEMRWCINIAWIWLAVVWWINRVCAVSNHRNRACEKLIRIIMVFFIL